MSSLGSCLTLRAPAWGIWGWAALAASCSIRNFLSMQLAGPLFPLLPDAAPTGLGAVLAASKRSLRFRRRSASLANSAPEASIFPSAASAFRTGASTFRTDPSRVRTGGLPMCSESGKRTAPPPSAVVKGPLAATWPPLRVDLDEASELLVSWQLLQCKARAAFAAAAAASASAGLSWRLTSAMGCSSTGMLNLSALRRFLCIAVEVAGSPVADGAVARFSAVTLVPTRADTV
eukprot:CAMPEP_0171081226 /NCGR_PEP_ID=MMETSP0766_2-20121228/16370_1 /TAXON_ID=439317 /ORGANISM="Gambierdiscus australes, Strain CAWD 149" /LENGTH=232 /DNA_ID=CAMNT_0011538519 /DNA_START=139 /DNA_END=833 /DNA_ORIENTATION=-